jgi:hypothetical protein
MLWVVSAHAGIEYVTLIKVLDDDDKGIIERSNIDPAPWPQPFAKC